MKTLEYWFAWLSLATLNLLPKSVAAWAVPFYAKLLDLAVPRLRRVALRNLELAGLANRERIVDGVFRSIGRIVVSFAQFPRITRDNVNAWIGYEGLHNFTTPQARRRGVLVATAHLGNWELSAFTHALMTGPMRIVVRPLDNSRVDAMVEHRRALSGNGLIYKKEAAREILRALKGGEAVGILIDQNSSLDEGIFVDFFGRKACANAAFVKFAHRTGAPVVPGFALWSDEKQRYILRFYPEIPMSGDVQTDTQRVHTVLEQVIRAHPEQWLWIHRRWKTRPPGQPDLYS